MLFIQEEIWIGLHIINCKKNLSYKFNGVFMTDKSLNRKDFVLKLTQLSLGICSCGVAGGLLQSCSTVVEPEVKTVYKTDPAAQKRLDFVDHWVKRFMDVVDDTLDENTKKKLIMNNGKICFEEYAGSKVQKMTFEQLKNYIKNNPQDQSMQVEGNTIYFQYLVAAADGKPAPEGKCLCALVESKPKNLSSTYCLCSLGYVKRWFELMLNEKIEIELIESVLRGGKRCKFKLTVG